MKKLLIMIALVAGVAFISKAQGGRQMGTPEERAQRTIDGQRMAAYNFTADQKTKITVILVRQNKSSDSLRATMPAPAAGADRAAMMASMQAMAPKLAPITAANEAAIVALLTTDQKKTYDAALAAAKERNPNATTVIAGGFGGRGQGGGRPPGQ